MKRFKCRITKDKELLVERIPGKSYYYKFTFKYLEDIVMNHKRSVIIFGDGRLLGVSYSYGYYEKPFEDLKYRISQQVLYELIRSSESS
jgi:hypothetical protein